MKRLSAISAFAALALSTSLQAGCNLTAAQIQQVVDTGKQLAQKLAEAGVKLQIADSSGKQVSLTKSDIKQVFLDGQELSPDKYDVVGGEIRFKDLLEKNSGQKAVKIVLKGGTVIDNVKIDTTEGKETANEARFIAGPGGRMTAVDAGKSLEDAAKERLAEARKSGVVVKLGIPGLNDATVEAIGVQAAGAAEGDPVFVLPRTAFSATPDGGIVFDVQFLSVLTSSAAATGAGEADIKAASWYVVHKTPAGHFALHEFRLLKGLQQADPATGNLPDLQLLDEVGSEFSEPEAMGVYPTFESLTAGVTLVDLDEFGNIPPSEEWAEHKVDDFDDGYVLPPGDDWKWEFDQAASSQES